VQRNLISVLIFVPTLFLAAAWPQPALAQDKAVGPILKIIPDPIHFDSVTCRVRVCRPVTFMNIGDTTLVVHNHDRILRPFYVRIDTPLTLLPGEQRVFEYCYTPNTWSSDSQQVGVRVDSRVPMSVGMIFDVSASMLTLMPDGKTRIEATHKAGREFVGYLLDTLGIQDDAAVYTYDDRRNFALVQQFTSDTALLRAAIPAYALGTMTCTYNALSRVIDSIRSSSRSRFIVLLTDGDDSGKGACGPDGVDEVIQKARDADTRVYVVSIGVVDHTDLQRIARLTGGEYFNANTSLDLLAIYRQIATELSKNNSIRFTTFGNSVGALLEIEPKRLNFDSVQVGQSTCLPVSIRNGGNVSLPADSVRSLFTPPFSLHDLMPDVILPYQTVTATICFSPILPLDYSKPIVFLASPCMVFPDTIHTSARSYLLPRDALPRPMLTHGPFAFDTTLCRTTECRDLVFRNSGDTILTVQTVDTLQPPFYGSIAAPFSIDAGGEKSFRICYYPESAPRHDTLRLGYEADLRPEQNIALLFDEGGSMGEEFIPGVSRLTAAMAGALDFLEGLLFDGAAGDHVAVLRFTDTASASSTGFISDIAVLRSFMSDTVKMAPSCIFRAVEHKTASFPHRIGARKLLLFTAGIDEGSLCGVSTAESAGQAAAAAGVNIVVLHLGDTDSTDLERMALGSGGEYHRPRDLHELILVLRDIDTRMMEHVRREISAVAQSVTPFLVTDATEIDFASVEIGGRVERRVVIRNTGDAELRIPRPAFRASSLYLDCIPLPDTVTVSPGDSAVLCMTFEPMLHGPVSDTLFLSHNGCLQGDIPLPVQGRSVARPAPWSWPMALNLPADVDFASSPCGQRNCSALRVDNPARLDALLRIIQAPGPPFDIRPSEALHVPAGASAVIDVCFEAERSGDASDILVLESGHRTRYGVVLLLARDASMSSLLPDGLIADDAAAAAIRAVQRNMDTSYQDILHVYASSGDSLRLLHQTPRDSAAFSIETSPDGPADELGPAMRQAIDVAGAMEGGRHVVLLASEIKLEQGFEASALAAYAAARGVHLHFQLFAPRQADTLRNHAGTLWTYAEYSGIHAMSAALHGAMLKTQRSSYDTVRLSGSGVSPAIEVEPRELAFGTVRVGDERCLPVLLRNTGPVTLHFSTILNPGDPLPVEVMDSIAVGKELRLDFCYTAGSLGADTFAVRIVYQACPVDTILLSGSAFGSDSVTVGIDAFQTGKPGEVTHIPVHLYAAVPRAYDVREIEIEVEFNKTMLYPLDPRPAQSSTLVGDMQPEALTLSSSYDDAMARVLYRVSGRQALRSEAPGMLLLRLPFLVLLGDALSTPVRITGIRFNDGLPRGGVAINSEFRVDSLCHIGQRLLDAGRRVSARISTTPNPFMQNAVISVDVSETLHARLTVHDALGRVVAELSNGVLHAGHHAFVFDASGLPSGLYLARFEADGLVIVDRFHRIR
jgi:hypothetical protein